MITWMKTYLDALGWRRIALARRTRSLVTSQEVVLENSAGVPAPIPSGGGQPSPDDNAAGDVVPAVDEHPRQDPYGHHRALLVVFAIATAVSALFIKRVIAELEAIADYHLQLAAIAATIDVETYEYELNLRRLLQAETVQPDQLAATVRRQQEIARDLGQLFDRAFALLAAAIKDERNDVSDRMGFARIEGAFEMLRRHVMPSPRWGRPC